MKFLLMNNCSFLFGFEIRERAFFRKLYKEILKLDKNLVLLKDNVDNIQNEIINKELGSGLSKTVLNIGNLYKLVNNSKFLKEKNKFFIFLKDLLNEAIDEYLKIFTALKDYKEKTIENKSLELLSSKRLEIYQNNLDKIKQKIQSLKI